MGRHTPIDTVGIRDLKAHLSRHLRRVRTGTRLHVTERGRTIATISPAHTPEEPVEIQWARKMVLDGQAQWSGGKPEGTRRPATPGSGPTVSDAVLEDRR
jgi:prevent-host-death family protein